MKIIYAADRKFREMLEISLFHTHIARHESFVWDLGDLGFGFEWQAERAESSKELRYRKPQYMNAALSLLCETAIWMDADAIIRQPIDELESDDYDIAVTALPKLKLCACPVVMHHTDRAHQFMEEYTRAVKTAPRGDMYGLRAHFDKYHTLTPESIGQVVSINGVRVKVLDSKVYLHKVRTMDDVKNIPDYVKIVHFSGLGHRTKRDGEKLALMNAYEDCI